jgi:hypothetical protein
VTEVVDIVVNDPKGLFPPNAISTGIVRTQASSLHG